MFQLKSPLSERVSVSRARLYVFLSLLALILFWDSSVVFPVKIFVVFIHELSHLIAVLISGGSIIEFSFNLNEGGNALTRGGNKFLILNAGYLGSSLFGGVIVFLACRTNWDRFFTFIIGLTVFFITFRYADKETATSFAYLASGFAIISAIVLPNLLCEAILIFVGLACCCYALLDIVDDVLIVDKSKLSDAVMLSQYTKLPTVFWGALWLLIAFGIGIYSLRLSIQGREKEESLETEEETLSEEDKES